MLTKNRIELALLLDDLYGMEHGSMGSFTHLKADLRERGGRKLLA